MSEAKKRKLGSTADAIEAVLSDRADSAFRAQLQSSSSFKVGQQNMLLQWQAPHAHFIRNRSAHRMAFSGFAVLLLVAHNLFRCLGY